MRQTVPIPASVTDEEILKHVSELKDHEWQEIHDMAELEGSLSEKEMVAQIRKTNLAQINDGVTTLWVEPRGRAWIFLNDAS